MVQSNFNNSKESNTGTKMIGNYIIIFVIQYLNRVILVAHRTIISSGV